METVLVALITGIFAVIQIRMNRKTNEIHKQVTVNHHSSAEPTLKDLITDLRDRFDDHIEWHLTHRDR